MPGEYHKNGSYHVIGCWSDAIARRAGRELQRFRRSHPDVDLADYLIAATAEKKGATLVTFDVRHFPMIKGLRAPW